MRRKPLRHPSWRISRSSASPNHHALGSIRNSRIADYAANPNEAIRFAGPPTRRIRLENLVLKKGTYGVFGNGEGKSTWERFADESQSVWKNVTVLGANVSPYPRGTKASAGPTEGVDPARIRAKVANVVVPP